MKIIALLLTFITLISNAQAHPELQNDRYKQYVVHEIQPDGRVRVRIIAEDFSLRESQDQISQILLSDKLMTAKEFANFHAPQMQSQSLNFPKRGQPLWVPVKNFWAQSDEDNYSTWFKANASESFLSQTGIKVDCADTALVFRWIYARENRLPVANTLLGSAKLFGHFSSSSAWDQLPTDPDWKKDRKFKAALGYLFDHTGSISVVRDIAPTFITPAYVRPGSLFIIIRPKSAHSQTITEVDPQYGIQSIWGNEPAAEEIFATNLLVEFQNKQTFGVWRRPRLQGSSTWQLTPATEMPGYSLEQFKQNFQNAEEFVDWVNDRLGVHVDDGDKLMSRMSDFVSNISMRLNVTASGVFACYYKSCSVSSQDYSDFSTFSRDARLLDLQAQAAKLIAKMDPNDSSLDSVMRELDGYGELIIGTGLTYRKLFTDAAALKKINSDPRVSYAERWGLDPNDLSANFLSLSQIMLSFLDQRYYMVAYDNSTSQLDLNFEVVFTKAKAAAQNAAVSPAAVSTVRDSFAQHLLNYDSQLLCGTSLCNYNDVTWGDGSADIVSRWSPNSGNSAATRWGISQ